MKKGIYGLALLLSAAIAVPSAEAVTFSAVGNTTTQNFSQDVDGPGGNGPITATATLTVASISLTQLVLNVQLTNTTTAASGFTTVGLEAFGFSIDPNATSVTGTTTGANDTGSDRDDFTGYSLDSIASLKNVEICAWAGNNCKGGPQPNLLHFGETDFFRLTINFPTNNTDSSYDLADFGAKFQTNLQSYEFYASSGTTTVTPSTHNEENGNAPEPALLSMLGAGLAGVAYRIRRRS